MVKRDIVVIGTSAGGVEALKTIVAGVREDFNASIFVVMHSGPDSPGLLGQILNRVSVLPVVTACDKAPIEGNQIYVAPPDRHMILERGTICLSSGPKENRFRPAIDPLFRSAAQVYGPRVIGVVLTGGLDDGTAGLWAVKQLGGIAVVQDPSDALFPSMPTNALNNVEVDHCVPLAEMSSLLTTLTETMAEEKVQYEKPEYLDLEVSIAKQTAAIDYDVRNIWEKSSFTCPECHGVLLQLKEGNRERFRCHTGHAFSEDSLLAFLTEGVEESLWTTIRNIEESALLMRHMAEHLQKQDPSAAREFLQKADEARRRSELVRKAVFQHEELNVERVEEAAQT